MPSKWQKYETTSSDPHYQAITKACVDILGTLGAFSKEEALKLAGFSLFDSESFRWDHIKRMVEEEIDNELIPLASQFFSKTRDKRHGKEYPAEEFPGRYIAHGYGKKTMGWCVASQGRNGHFFITQLNLKREQVKGKAKAHDKLLRQGRREAVPTARGKVLIEPNIP